METIANISGMTCAHCVGSVTEELSALEGVQNVVVELTVDGISHATITSTTALDSERISDAVTDAGYHLVSADA